MSTVNEWIARTNPALLNGDADAIAAIRRETFRALGLPIETDAPVFVWNGIWVRAQDDALHQIPDIVKAAYVETPPPPGMPRAVWPTSPSKPFASVPEDASTDPNSGAYAAIERPEAVQGEEVLPARTRRQKLLDLSLGIAEGSDRAIQELIQRTRRHHEVVPDMFPREIEVHWFEHGLHLIGPGDSPLVFQAAMSQLTDMIEPRAYPQLPLVRMPK